MAEKLMTVAEYASHIGKSVPLIYKQIKNKQVKSIEKFGRKLIVVK
jgi:hypothetical protein